MKLPAWARLVGVILLLGLTVGACSGSDDDSGDTPTSVPTAVLTAVTPTQAPAEIGGTLASDGICQIAIPDDWSDDGTARGRTSANARWTLFGNLLGSDTEWATAVNLLKNQQGSRPGAVVDEQPDRVVITQAENRSIVVRQRFPDRYCELSVTSTSDVTPETLALWTQVAAGMTPVDSQ